VTVGIVIHEFLHALGFYHQHSAIDRDDYVTINWQNIEPGNVSVFTYKNAVKMHQFPVHTIKMHQFPVHTIKMNQFPVHTIKMHQFPVHTEYINFVIFVHCILILSKFLFTNECTSDCLKNKILKFTLKQLRHVSVQTHTPSSKSAIFVLAKVTLLK
jgi:hypothetical protein